MAGGLYDFPVLQSTPKLSAWQRVFGNPEADEFKEFTADASPSFLGGNYDEAERRALQWMKQAKHPATAQGAAMVIGRIQEQRKLNALSQELPDVLTQRVPGQTIPEPSPAERSSVQSIGDWGGGVGNIEIGATRRRSTPSEAVIALGQKLLASGAMDTPGGRELMNRLEQALAQEATLENTRLTGRQAQPWKYEELGGQIVKWNARTGAMEVVRDEKEVAYAKGLIEEAKRDPYIKVSPEEGLVYRPQLPGGAQAAPVPGQAAPAPGQVTPLGSMQAPTQAPVVGTPPPAVGGVTVAPYPGQPVPAPVPAPGTLTPGALGAGTTPEAPKRPGLVFEGLPKRVNLTVEDQDWIADNGTWPPDHPNRGKVPVPPELKAEAIKARDERQSRKVEVAGKTASAAATGRGTAEYATVPIGDAAKYWMGHGGSRVDPQMSRKQAEDTLGARPFSQEEHASLRQAGLMGSFLRQYVDNVIPFYPETKEKDIDNLLNATAEGFRNAIGRKSGGAATLIDALAGQVADLRKAFSDTGNSGDREQMRSIDKQLLGKAETQESGRTKIRAITEQLIQKYKRAGLRPPEELEGILEDVKPGGPKGAFGGGQLNLGGGVKAKVRPGG